MDPTERLAADVQALKVRFDEMSLRFAVSEEREKRVDDKIDHMSRSVEQKMNAAVAAISAEVNGLKKSVDDQVFLRRSIMIGGIGVIVAALLRWVFAGNLAGVL